MAEKMNKEELKNATGSSRGSEGWVCDICGSLTPGDEIETYEIRIHLQSPKITMDLGRKDICQVCRNTHLAGYIAKNGLGPVDGVDMKGPL